MKIKTIQKLIYYTVFIAVFFSACAKIVQPTGGPKDEQHPLIEEINPPDYSINFETDEIKITFDEFIQLKELNNNLIVSPPVEEKLDIKVKGKTLLINFEEELKDSTTYNIYFGNSVQDYNEGNPIENFQYVLSTGSYIDSLSIEGQVVNSFNLLPEADVFVMLYSENTDSIPIKEIPVYISKTNEEGFFRINNIKHDEYKLFCLRDFNKNYLFDIPDEEIAFIDSLVVFDIVTELTSDTIYYLNVDSLVLVEDSLSIDSIIEKSYSHYPVKNYVFRLFAEDLDVQYLANNTRDIKQKIEFVFNNPIKDSVVLSIADTVMEDWFIKEKGINNDSLTYWLTDSSLYNREELTFLLRYQKEDSNLVFQWNTDTLDLRFFEQEVEKKKKNDEEKVDTSLKYNLNIKSRGTIDLNNNLKFAFETPLQYFDTTKIDLFAVIDTIRIPVKFDFARNNKKLREFHMDVKWGEDTIYKLEVYPGAFTDIYQTKNDTSILEFVSQKRNYYGRILADISGIDSSFQAICQIILQAKEEEKVVREKIIQSDQIITYDFMPPKEFILKIIIDKNFNNKWDTGEYLKHLQAEEVLYYDSKIEMRSDWDIEINFNVNRK